MSISLTDGINILFKTSNRPEELFKMFDKLIISKNNNKLETDAKNT